MSLYLGENLISGNKPINLGVRNIGEVFPALLPVTDAGAHLLDGSLILGGGIYQGFVDYIASIVSIYPSAFTTESAWQSSVSTYGACGKFVYDSTNNTVRLPKVSDILQGTTDLTALGDLVQAGLPSMTTSTAGGHNHNRGDMNITGWATTALGAWQTAGSAGGAFSVGAYSGAQVGSSGNPINRYNLDLNAANGWTGNTSWNGDHSHTVNTGVRQASTVQPQTIKVLYYIVIANSTKTEIQSDIDEIATDLNSKMDTDLSNMSASVSAKSLIASWGMPDYENQIVGSYPSGGSWIRVTKDSFVCIWGGDPYMENYAVYVSPDTSASFVVGIRGDDVNGNTQITSFTFFVPKNWYFLCQAENGGEYRIYPLKGAQ